MYLCLNKLISKAWKKNCPNLYATVQSWKKVKVIIFPFILGSFSFVSNAASFFIHSLNWFDFFFLNFQLGALYANIRHEYNQ